MAVPAPSVPELQSATVLLDTTGQDVQQPQQPEHMRVFMPGSIGVLERQLAFSHTSEPMYYTDPGRRCSLVLAVIEDAIYLF